MKRFFNTSGPCDEGRHYMLPPRLRLGEIAELIEELQYFVIHAPRQTGKTTSLMAYAQKLTASGRYASIVVSCEVGQAHKSDIGMAELALLGAWRDTIDDGLPEALRPPPWPEAPVGVRIQRALSAWARACPLPLVLIMDEIDALVDDSLISLLRQLRSGYPRRPAGFPSTVILVGLRDVRDYKAKIRAEVESMGTASPFNIKSDSILLRNFTEPEVAQLYAQHTEATGQVFEPGAVARAFELTQGQPWLVNALARQLVKKEVPDPTQPVTHAHVNSAKDALILRRDTHIDSLAAKLREDRVRKVIEPILAGTSMGYDVMNDDILYARDLGLVAAAPPLRIANPIYQEIIPRTLTFVWQYGIDVERAWYTLPDGSLDMSALLRAFQSFFAENAEAWLGRFDYQEAGPHLMLMAFLQRVVNGGGEVQREFAAGSGRADLLVLWKGHRYALELKLRRGERTLKQGLEQLDRYLDRLGESEGWLLIFDRREGRTWEEKLYEQDSQVPSGRTVHVFGA